MPQSGRVVGQSHNHPLQWTGQGIALHRPSGLSALTRPLNGVALYGRGTRMGIGNWFSRWLSSKSASTSVPDGWTDDMTVSVQPPHTLSELVDFVLDAESRKVPSPDTVSNIAAGFGLSEDDAALAWDRALGGLVRAATGNSVNCPDKDKDPVAWISYQRCLLEPALIAAIRPQYATGR